MPTLEEVINCEFQNKEEKQKFKGAISISNCYGKVDSLIGFSPNATFFLKGKLDFEGSKLNELKCKIIIDGQNHLDENYPLERRIELNGEIRLYFLSGYLTLENFNSDTIINLTNSPQAYLGPQRWNCKVMRDAQKYLDYKYPLRSRNFITELNLVHSYLAGELILEGFSNLRKVNCSNNFLISLVIKCPTLILFCHNNSLERLEISYPPKELICNNNKLPIINLLMIEARGLTLLSLDNYLDNYLISDYLNEQKGKYKGKFKKIRFLEKFQRKSTLVMRFWQGRSLAFKFLIEKNILPFELILMIGEIFLPLEEKLEVFPLELLLNFEDNLTNIEKKNLVNLINLNPNFWYHQTSKASEGEFYSNSKDLSLVSSIVKKSIFEKKNFN